MAKFNKLDVPYQWKDEFTKYPHGYTIFEALCKWVKQVDEMVDNVNDWNDYLDNFVENFEFELQEEVQSTITRWQNEGLLDEIIASALNTELDKVKSHLKNISVDVKEFGAVGDGVTDDTEAIQSAYNSLNDYDTLTISPGTYKITNLVFNNPKVYIDFRGRFVQDKEASGSAITIGGESFSTIGTFYRGILDVRKESRNWSVDSVGIDLINVDEAVLTTNTSDFKRNIVLRGIGRGCCYNNIYIIRNVNAVRGIEFIRDEDGWVNENKFHGGRFTWFTGVTSESNEEFCHIYIPDYSMNNNIFYSPNLEGSGGKFIYCNGQYNTFYSPRLEGNSTKVHFGPNSIYNQLIYPYAHTYIPDDDAYIDEGTRNHIYGRDHLLLPLTIVQAGNYKAVGSLIYGQDGLFEAIPTSTSADKVFVGKNSGREITSSIDGNGDANFRSVTIGDNAILFNGQFQGTFYASPSYVSNNFVPWAVSANIPTSLAPRTGTAVFCTANNKLYIKLGDSGTGQWLSFSSD